MAWLMPRVAIAMPALIATPMAAPAIFARRSICLIRLSAVRAARSIPRSNPPVFAIRSIVSEPRFLAAIVLPVIGRRHALDQRCDLVECGRFVFQLRPRAKCFRLDLIGL